MKQIEERRLFTYDERKSTLKRTYGICACCGRKLTTKTMTVEHVIPLNRGGTNDLKNLIALCYDCNQLKSNMLYLPSAFYSAISHTPLLKELEKQMQIWFQEIKNEFDLIKYPMISPRTTMLIAPPITGRKTKSVFTRTLLLQWSYVGTEYYAEIEAVTGLSIREIREKTNKYCYHENSPVAIYSLRKVSTDKILAIMCVLYDPDKNHICLYFPWSCMPHNENAKMFYNAIINLHYAISTIATQPLDICTAVSDCQHTFDYIYKSYFENSVIPIGYAWKPLHYDDAMDAVSIMFTNSMYPKTTTQEKE